LALTSRERVADWGILYQLDERALRGVDVHDISPGRVAPKLDSSLTVVANPLTPGCRFGFRVLRKRAAAVGKLAGLPAAEMTGMGVAVSGTVAAEDVRHRDCAAHAGRPNGLR
jgi:hypothetical protein